MIGWTRTSKLGNLALFALIAVSAGWIGLALNNILGLTDATKNLGVPFFLLLPPMAGILLRALGGDGWVDIGWRLKCTAISWGMAIFVLLSITIIRNACHSSSSIRQPHPRSSKPT